MKTLEGKTKYKKTPPWGGLRLFHVGQETPVFDVSPHKLRGEEMKDYAREIWEATISAKL